MNVAVILAGGSGRRLGGDLPKQFLEVAGSKIIEHTLTAFDTHEGIDEIAVVCNPDYLDEMERVLSTGKWNKVRKVLPGGKERYHSSLAAIEAYPDDNICLLLHDAVRPLVSHRIITDCIEALHKWQAVTVAVPTTDTILVATEEETVRSIPDRATLHNVQTPQGFRRGIIRLAYERALQDAAFRTTDDCGTVLRYLPEVPIHIVKGETSNLKVTYADDLTVAEKLLAQKKEREGM